MSGCENREREAELLAQARSGNAAAFDCLVTAHRESVYMQAYLICRNSEDALDVCQETFLRAWRALRSFDGRQPFAAWLRRIAANAAIDLCRRRARRPEVEMDNGAADAAGTTGETPRHALERAELAKRIQAAFGALSPEHRAVIALRDVEGLSYKEIAAAVGCSVGTVMSRLFYARQKLRQHLADCKP